MQWLLSPCGINDQMPSIVLVVGQSKSHERQSWTGGTSSDFLLVRAVHRKGNYLFWINSVSCCYFFFSWILFPRNTISWWISGLLLLTRLGVSFSVPVQKFLSRVWTTPYVQCFCFLSREFSASGSRAFLSGKEKENLHFLLGVGIGLSSPVTTFCLSPDRS